MSVSPSVSTYTTNLRSTTPIPTDNRQIRISGRLLRICDTVYIPELRYNGTIINIVGRFVIFLPHDYGPSISRLPRNLKTGNGISTHQRRWLDRISVAYHDKTWLLQGTVPARHRGKSFVFSFYIKKSLTSPSFVALGRRPVFSLLCFNR